ncbi:hydrogenase 3 large subunit [Thermococcus litoralis DSM 5473]|uniref:Formate hydrogenlyase subunit F n=1 Tax=Thermococcus litoralis (strain ATCC 51850 / DSM 5473 / JCM 8560 / NS-C) TaxID=523849 RepID=A8JYL2_THELN|nr:NADH-quinone oxidoreductase subunit C [Thermococcus litoralis]ABW05546.1 formate hydrogenlyase subunit F [Thermococcus litoralis DSM 5473]EHR78449.1 hydrogenase 3 large subunit [Thermococcus litoralis DSM 5473]
MIREFEEKFGMTLEKKVIAKNKVLYTLMVRREDFPNIINYILSRPNTRLFTMVGMDERNTEEAFSVTYWFLDWKDNEVIGIRLYVPEDEPYFPSVGAFHKGAIWFEREVQDLLGLKAEGLPDPRRLILPDDWPEGVYPLREDFQYYHSPAGTRGYSYREPPKDSTVHPMGPYHVALDEPAHFRLFVKGEEIVDVDYRGFYSHRGIEKLARGRLNYNQIVFIAERICGICGFAHSVAYAQAVEEAGRIEVPDRARYIRTILLEIERLHSHLLWLGIAAHLTGFDTAFMRSWEIREKVMELAERLTGNRKTYGLVLVGGVRRDLLDYRKSLILETLKNLKKDFDEFVDMLISTKSFVRRCEGIGVLPKEKAREWDTAGPLARASGIDYDTRKSLSYAAYDELSFDVPVYKEGDVLARALVRIDEVRESISLLEQAIDAIPGGPVMGEFNEIPSWREGISAVEAPRGENTHYVMTGEVNRIYRWRVKAPTYNNLQAVPDMLRGYTIADAPLIVASIDPCYSCTERVQVVDVKSGKTKVISLGGGIGTCP